MREVGSHEGEGTGVKSGNVSVRLLLLFRRRGMPRVF